MYVFGLVINKMNLYLLKIHYSPAYVYEKF